jgi:CRISPR-associated protein Cst2
LLATLIKPAGAQCNTQTPHILACCGVVATSKSYLPAPMLSPLSGSYSEEIGSIAETLNRLIPGGIEARPFECLATGAALMERIAGEVGSP